MLKKQIFTLCALFTLVLACSKKDKNDDTPPVNSTVKAIQDYLSQTDSTKTFSASFKAVTFTDADVNNGLTVFAPANSAIASYNSNTSLTADEIKDHVVKGLFKKADLTSGTKLTTLSGKSLFITVDGDKIMVNGAVVLTSKEETSYSVFTIDNVLCKKPGIAEITVMDGTQWSTTDTSGKPAANADVILYSSRKDLTNSNPPAYTGKTDASGKITFANVPAGTYYLVSKKDDKLNYFEPQINNGELVAYKPVGIYQDANQLSTLPRLGLPGVGDFIFLDANMDGIINTNDKIAAPFEVVVASNNTVQVKSLIGYTQNQLALPFASKADAQQYLSSVYPIVFGWHQLQTVMDGVMSDDADCIGLSAFCPFDNFSFDATNSYITNFWLNGYTGIAMLNRVINNVPALNLSAAEANDLIGQAKGLRGFMYYELATYFGGLPLQTGATDYNLSRSTTAATYTFIKNDLGAAISVLQPRYTGTDRHRINGDVCKLLLARVAMAQGDWQNAQGLTNDLIISSTYTLMPAATIFTSDDNAEVIWNIQAGFASPYTAFYNGNASKTFTPVARYAEVLLINSEATAYMGTLNATYTNQLLTRRGQSTVTFTDPYQASDLIKAAWKSEMPREGQRFAKLVMWQKDVQTLGSNGFTLKNRLFPIPASVLVKNPNLNQNLGF